MRLFFHSFTFMHIPSSAASGVDTDNSVNTHATYATHNQSAASHIHHFEVGIVNEADDIGLALSHDQSIQQQGDQYGVKDAGTDSAVVPEGNGRRNSLDPLGRKQVQATKTWATSAVVYDRDSFDRYSMTLDAGSSKGSKSRSLETSFEDSVDDQADGNYSIKHDVKMQRDEGCCSLNRWINPSFREAREISYISIVFTAVSFILDAVVSVEGSSTATLGAGLDSLLDVVSSCLVIWRFYAADVDPAILAWRERLADFVLSWLFIIVGLFVFGLATRRLSHHSHISDEDLLLASNIPTVIVLSILSHIKFHVYRALNSQTMLKDAIGSFTGAGVSLGVCIGIVIEQGNPDIWWVDAVIAMMVAVFIAYIGGSSLQDMGQWWKKSYWLVHPEIQEGIHESHIEVPNRM